MSLLALLLACREAEPPPPAEPAPAAEPAPQAPPGDVVAWKRDGGGFVTWWIRDGSVVAERPELVVWDGALLAWSAREGRAESWRCSCPAAPSCCEPSPSARAEAPAECRVAVVWPDAALVALGSGEVAARWPGDPPSGWVETAASVGLRGGVGGRLLVESRREERWCDQEYELGAPPEVVSFELPARYDAGEAAAELAREGGAIELLGVLPVRDADGRLTGAMCTFAVARAAEGDVTVTHEETSVSCPLPEAWRPWRDPHPGLAAAGVKAEAWNRVAPEEADEALALFRAAAPARRVP